MKLVTRKEYYATINQLGRYIDNIKFINDMTINRKLCHHKIYVNNECIAYSITDGCNEVLKTSEYYLSC